MSKTTKRLRNLLGMARRPKPVIAPTPFEVVHEENKWRLLRYQQSHRRYREPLLLVPSLINRHYVLDLMPGKSFVAYLVAQGFDVFVIDWGTPGDEDRYLSFDTVCDTYIGRALRRACKLADTDSLHLLGYCLGGTLCCLYTAVHGERVKTLTTLAAPVDFDHGGTMAQWTRSKGFDVDALVAGTGNVPWQLMQTSFHMLKPTLSLVKAVGVVDRAWDDEFLDGFVATEHWGNDNVAFPGSCYRDYIVSLYRDNALVKNQMSLHGKPARLDEIRCPIAVVSFEDDHIVPKECAAPLCDLVASEDVEHIHLRGGHVGAVVSRKASERLWPRLRDFWSQRSSAITLPNS